jgi:hypothetical protein
MKVIELFENEDQPMLFSILQTLLEKGDVYLDVHSIYPYTGADDHTIGKIVKCTVRETGWLGILVELPIGAKDLFVPQKKVAHLRWKSFDDNFTIEMRNGTPWLVNL